MRVAPSTLVVFTSVPSELREDYEQTAEIKSMTLRNLTETRRWIELLGYLGYICLMDAKVCANVQYGRFYLVLNHLTVVA